VRRGHTERGKFSLYRVGQGGHHGPLLWRGEGKRGGREGMGIRFNSSVDGEKSSEGSGAYFRRERK